jgi:hypothetical protein
VALARAAAVGHVALAGAAGAGEAHVQPRQRHQRHPAQDDGIAHDDVALGCLFESSGHQLDERDQVLHGLSPLEFVWGYWSRD